MQIINKPIEEMTIEELKEERLVHIWQANKSERGAKGLEKSLYWLDEHRPKELTANDVNWAIEKGYLEKEQKNLVNARRAKAVGDRKRAQLKQDYALMIAREERAIVARIDERLLELEAKAPAPKMGRPPKRDPRKRAVNQKTYKASMSVKKLWAQIEKSNKDNAKCRAKLAPIRTFNAETLYTIGRDRGYLTKDSLLFDISRTLEMSLSATKEAIRTGKLTYGQVLIIGGLLQMTPREFCDTFLYDYFKEISETYGLFQAVYDEEERALLDKPIKGDY